MIIQNQSTKITTTLIIFCLALNIAITTTARVKTSRQLHGKYMLDYDAYRYVREAKIISKHGYLPQKDMMRNYPLGRDLTKKLVLNSYFIAYFHKFLRIFYPYLTVEKAAIYFPVVCFVLSTIAFFLLASELLNKFSATLATTIFAIVPGMLYKTSAGAADRDALWITLHLFAFYLFIKANNYSKNEKNHKLSRLLIFSAFSGIAMGLIGLTWPGVGLLMSIIVVISFVRLLTDEFDIKQCYIYLSWYATSTGMLLIFTRVYTRVLDHMSLLAFVPATTFLLMVMVPYLLIRRKAHWQAIFSLKNRVPLGVTLVAISAILLMVVCSFAIGTADFFKHAVKLYQYLTYPVGNNRLMRSVAELQPFRLDTWWNAYGLLLPFVLVGFGMILHKLSPHYGISKRIVVALGMFMVTGVIASSITSESMIDGRSSISQFIYMASVITFIGGIIMLWLYSRNKRESRDVGLNNNMLLMVVWFTILFIVTRSARRFNILFTPVAVIVASYAISEIVKHIAESKPKLANLLLLCMTLAILSWTVSGFGYNIFSFAIKSVSFGNVKLLTPPRINMNISLLLVVITGVIGTMALQRNKINWKGITNWLVLTGILVIMIGGIPPFVQGYIGYPSAKLALTEEWQDALNWLKQHTDSDSVIAAWWDLGNWIVTVAERTTIIDNDELIPYWIHLLSRHVFTAQSYTESLECLRSYGATHLLLSARNIVYQSTGFGQMGSDAEGDRDGFIQMFEWKPKLSFGCQPSCGGVQEETVLSLFPFKQRKGYRASININGNIYRPDEWKIQNISVVISEGNEAKATATIKVKGQKIELPIEQCYFKGKRYVCAETNVLPGMVVLMSDIPEMAERVDRLFYVHEKLCNSLIVKLYLLKDSNENFKLVYPASKEYPSGGIRIWEIRYPDSLGVNSDYLKQKFPDAKLYQPLY